MFPGTVMKKMLKMSEAFVFNGINIYIVNAFLTLSGLHAGFILKHFLSAVVEKNRMWQAENRPRTRCLSATFRTLCLRSSGVFSDALIRI